MKLKFWKREPDYDDIEFMKPKRKKETIGSASDKILIRRMKKQPDGFGLEIAMRHRGLEKEKPQNLKEMMKEQVELRKLTREYFGYEEGQPDSGMLGKLLNSDMAKAFAEATAQNLAKMMAPQMQKQMQQQEQQAQIAQSQAEQQALAQPEQQQLPQETIRMPKLDELLPYLEEEPQDVISMLKEREDEQARLWLTLLSKSSYRQICQLLRPVQEKNPELESLIGDLLHEDREKWWRELLEAAKRAI